MHKAKERACPYLQQRLENVTRPDKWSHNTVSDNWMPLHKVRFRVYSCLFCPVFEQCLEIWTTIQYLSLLLQHCPNTKHFSLIFWPLDDLRLTGFYYSNSGIPIISLTLNMFLYNEMNYLCKQEVKILKNLSWCFNL